MAEGSRLPVDPKFVSQVGSSPNLMVEQAGSAFMQQYGSPRAYDALSKVGPVERDVFFAIQELESRGQPASAQDVSTVTGFTEPAVERAVKALIRAKVIQMSSSMEEVI